MMAQRSTENSGPLTWIGNFPVYASTVLAGIHGDTIRIPIITLGDGTIGDITLVFRLSHTIHTSTHHLVMVPVI